MILVASIVVIVVAKVVTEPWVLESETEGPGFSHEGHEALRSATKGTKAPKVQPRRHEGHEANVSSVVIFVILVASIVVIVVAKSSPSPGSWSRRPKASRFSHEGPKIQPRRAPRPRSVQPRRARRRRRFSHEGHQGAEDSATEGTKAPKVQPRRARSKCEYCRDLRDPRGFDCGDRRGEGRDRVLGPGVGDRRARGSATKGTNATKHV